MGVVLNQLPPADIARLKAELAETLVANFCYPRFYDYRTNTLRMRPVDRARRQEVWLYLSSIDFTSWGRIDLMAPDFQRHIERLIIQFVQRNRNFFGQQGRKRMADVRMLISSCALSVTQGLRGHVMGHPQTTPPFGSPRPVVSWNTTNVSGRPEPSWEQIVSATMQLQQQLQEVRGEIKPAVVSDVRTVPAQSNAHHAAQGRATGNGASATAVEHDLAPLPQLVPAAKVPPHAGARRSGPLHDQKSAAPMASVVAPQSDIPSISSLRQFEASGPTVEAPTLPIPVTDKTLESSPAVQPRDLPPTPQTPHTTVPVPVEQAKSNGSLVNEDIAIFDQMRHQLIVWLRIEAVRAGLDISGQAPLQLLELLRQQSTFDETRLQIISTLLNISNQVLKNGQASLLDYKQGLMLYLVHMQH